MSALAVQGKFIIIVLAILLIILFLRIFRGARRREKTRWKFE